MCLVYTVIISFLIVKSSTSDRNITCHHSAWKPKNDILKQMYNKWLGMNNRIYATFDLQSSLYKNRYKKVVVDSKAVFRQRIYGRPKCHKKLRRASDDLMDISLCPWYVEMTYDTDRYPEILASAKCKCKHCYSFNGERNRRSDLLYIPKCKEIKQMVKVLRIKKNDKGVRICQSNSNKLFSYINSYEEITVGCTCALKEDKRVKHRHIKIES